MSTLYSLSNTFKARACPVSHINWGLHETENLDVSMGINLLDKNFDFLAGGALGVLLLLVKAEMPIEVFNSCLLYTSDAADE